MPDPATELRRRAQEKLLRLAGDVPTGLRPDEIRQLVHELGVHQIELEMQNEELRSTQQRLEASSARLADLFDQAPIGYLTLRHPGLIHEANLTAAEFLADERAALLGRSLTRYLNSDDQLEFYKHWKAVLDTGLRQTVEVRVISSGHPVWTRMEITRSIDDQGVVATRVAMIDIHQRKLSEEALRQSEARYKTLFEETERQEARRLKAIGERVASLAGVLGGLSSGLAQFPAESGEGVDGVAVLQELAARGAAEGAELRLLAERRERPAPVGSSWGAPAPAPTSASLPSAPPSAPPTAPPPRAHAPPPASAAAPESL